LTEKEIEFLYFNMSRLFSARVALPAVLVALLAVSASPAHADVALNIIATFDSSITNDPNAAAIEATINSAINFYQTTFTTHTAAPIGVAIDFREMGSGLGESNTGLYKPAYVSFITALNAASSGDATDATALAGLPVAANNPVTSSTTIDAKSAELRALGFNTPGFVNGTFDGVIGLNTSITNPGSSGSPGPFSLLATVEHEIDEVLGLGSDVGGTGFFRDPAAEDLFRYDNTGNRSYTTTSTAQAFFSLDGTTDLAQFDNQDDGGDWGDWQSDPLPPTPKVQDAFATPGSSPSLAVGDPEVVALDALGYNLATSPVPEPTSLVFFGSVVAIAGIVSRRRAALTKSRG
jgi:hypothetical protein